MVPLKCALHNASVDGVASLIVATIIASIVRLFMEDSADNILMPGHVDMRNNRYAMALGVLCGYILVSVYWSVLMWRFPPSIVLHRDARIRIICVVGLLICTSIPYLYGFWLVKFHKPSWSPQMAIRFIGHVYSRANAILLVGALWMTWVHYNASASFLFCGVCVAAIFAICDKKAYCFNVIRSG